MAKSRLSKKNLADSLRSQSQELQACAPDISTKLIPTLFQFVTWLLSVSATLTRLLPVGNPITKTITQMHDAITRISEFLSKSDALIKLANDAANRLYPKNSINSSMPPGADQKRERKPKVKNGNRQGGQKNNDDTTLNKIDNPD
jgi:hypothetical protein